MIEWLLGGASALSSGLGVLLGFKNYNLAKKIAGFNLASQILNQKINLDYNREVMDFNKNMIDLQIQREDTAFQRAVEDLKRAGMSPILAVGNPASSGVYQTSFAPSNAPIIQQDYQYDLGSIYQFANVLGDLALKKEQANLLSSQSKLNDIKASSDLIDLQFKNLEKSLDIVIKQKNIEMSDLQIEKMKAEIPNIKAQLELLTHQNILAKKNIDFFEAEKSAITQLKQKILSNNKLSEREKMFYMIVLDTLDTIKKALTK
jgi:hypothetical protein